jgi:hypothetical protein
MKRLTLEFTDAEYKDLMERCESSFLTVTGQSAEIVAGIVHDAIVRMRAKKNKKKV